jgi:ribosomal protein S8
MNIFIINLIAQVNSAFKNKRSTVIYKFNKVSLNFIQALNKIGFFLKVEIKNKLVVLHLKPNKASLQKTLKIKLLSKPSNSFFFTLYQLKALCNKNKKTIFILSTKKGFLTNFEALHNNLGGEIICKTW